MTDELPEDRRRVLFEALVSAQDEGLSVAASRELVAGRYSVTVEQVRAVEQEGLRQGWPPLDG
ncbi:MAG TPA: hypothetical protein VKE74_29115 [Gemmataceae bacterium]|nr:hypothetical protein [Gemmataceae bacterium]